MKSQSDAIISVGSRALLSSHYWQDIRFADGNFAPYPTVWACHAAKDIHNDGLAFEFGAENACTTETSQVMICKGGSLARAGVRVQR